MRLNSAMESGITAAAAAVMPAIGGDLVDSKGRIDVVALSGATSTVARTMRSAWGPRCAVYITWDIAGRCRYVGSVRRATARAAVPARLGEHLRIDSRRATWYAVTVLGLRDELDLPVVRECEGIVARRLVPIDGSAHPVPSIERPLSDLVDTAIGASSIGRGDG